MKQFGCPQAPSRELGQSLAEPIFGAEMWLLANNSILYADRKEKAVDERPKTLIAGVLRA
jgi:hypothetical protein